MDCIRDGESDRECVWGWVHGGAGIVRREVYVTVAKQEQEVRGRAVQLVASTRAWKDVKAEFGDGVDRETATRRVRSLVKHAIK